MRRRPFPNKGRRRRAPSRVARVASTTGQQSLVADPIGQTRAWVSALLVFVYICIDISVYLVGDRASQGYTKQTVLFVSASCSIVIGTVASVSRYGKRAIWDCFAPMNVLRLLPVSACFLLSLLGLLLAFPYLDGAFIKLLGQMKLPLAAFLSSIVLGRRYSVVQWQVIFLICIACFSFTALKIGSLEVGAVPVQGLLCVLSWVGFNVLATLYAERAFKESTGMPFPILMTNMRIGELLAAGLMLAVLPGFRWAEFFRGWDRSTCAVLLTLLGDAWLSGLMVKRLSSVTKNVAKCCSLVVLYGVALATLQQKFVLEQALGALMIVKATALFVTVSMQAKEPEPKPASIQSISPFDDEAAAVKKGAAPG